MVGVPGHHGLAVASLVVAGSKPGRALVPGRPRPMAGKCAVAQTFRQMDVIHTPAQVSCH